MAIELARDPLPEYIPYSDESSKRKAIELLRWVESMPDWFCDKRVVWTAETDYINRWFPGYESHFDDFDEIFVVLENEQLFVHHVIDGVTTKIPFKFVDQT